MNYDIYEDISQRTQGDIYIGVVGPVRTGKSTFIKKFMDTLVIPNIKNSYVKERATDELPQSAAGKTVMTTEPKFVPGEAVELNLNDKVKMKVRLIDCVGYIVEAALGYMENDTPRMIRTPWDERPMPFDKAAEIGTRKVIEEHSTIGLVVTTDGSIGEIPRSEYIEAEKRVIGELSALGKPFAVVLNTVDPFSERTQALALSMEEEYGVPVKPVDCLNLDSHTITEIMQQVLLEFPVKEICIDISDWIRELPSNHTIRSSVFDTVTACARDIRKIRQTDRLIKDISANEYVSDCKLSGLVAGQGRVILKVETSKKLFYSVLSDTSGMSIATDGDLIRIMSDFAHTKADYDKISFAMAEADGKGYGIVSPSINELKLEEPEIVKQGNRYGVRLKASAPSYHIIKANIDTEVSPVVGSEKQSEELVKYLLTEFEEEPQKLWESNIFGKSLHELVNEGLNTKLSHMPDDSREKMHHTLEKIVNEGSGGLICIIL